MLQTTITSGACVHSRGKCSIPITGVIGGLATDANWCLVVITKADRINLGFLWIFFGLAIYYYFRKKQLIPPTGKVEIQKSKMSEFQAKKYKHILVPTRGGRETPSHEKIVLTSFFFQVFEKSIYTSS